MHNDNEELINSSNDYFKMLNKVNLLLLKEHTFLLEKKQYQEEINEIDALIDSFKNNPENHAHLSIQAEFDYLHSIIKDNKKEIAQLQMKLEKRDTMINYLVELNNMHSKY